MTILATTGPYISPWMTMEEMRAARDAVIAAHNYIAIREDSPTGTQVCDRLAHLSEELARMIAREGRR